MLGGVIPHGAGFAPCSFSGLNCGGGFWVYPGHENSKYSAWGLRLRRTHPRPVAGPIAGSTRGRGIETVWTGHPLRRLARYDRRHRKRRFHPHVVPRGPVGVWLGAHARTVHRALGRSSPVKRRIYPTSDFGGNCA